MRKQLLVLLLCILFVLQGANAQENAMKSMKIPFTLDHNRMLVQGEIRKSDGKWRKVLFWVDSGNPDFMISEGLAKDLGIDLSGKKTGENGYPLPLEVNPPEGIKLGRQVLDFSGIRTKVMFEPRWMFETMHIDANIPSTLLKKFDIVIDYPGMQISLASPGSISFHGEKLSASIDKKTGIVQLGGMAGRDSISVGLDIGASFSFISESKLKKITDNNSGWPVCKGSAGCANIWGWWPDEDKWIFVRIPEFRLGKIILKDIGMGGLPDFFSGDKSLGEWYSKKTAKPVDGILGPNAYKDCRIEIDYANDAVYLTQTGRSDPHDMDVVGLTIGLDPDTGYQVVGVVQKNGQAIVSGIEAGDMLLQIGNYATRGETMGKVVDALRGKPGEVKILTLERKGVQFQARVQVERLL
ncbi:MAG: PDZ domain-containing protein [Bacteroidota bacterium]